MIADFLAKILLITGFRGTPLTPSIINTPRHNSLLICDCHSSGLFIACILQYRSSTEVKLNIVIAGVGILTQDVCPLPVSIESSEIEPEPV